MSFIWLKCLLLLSLDSNDGLIFKSVLDFFFFFLFSSPIFALKTGWVGKAPILLIYLIHENKHKTLRYIFKIDLTWFCVCLCASDKRFPDRIWYCAKTFSLFAKWNKWSYIRNTYTNSPICTVRIFYHLSPITILFSLHRQICEKIQWTTFRAIFGRFYRVYFLLSSVYFLLWEKRMLLAYLAVGTCCIAHSSNRIDKNARNKAAKQKWSE